MIEGRKITIGLDRTQIGALEWPNTVAATITHQQPSLDPPCAVITCKEQANPLNVVEAPLDVFGSPVVRVCFCDDHFRMFGETTEEHEKPDLMIEEH